MTDKITKAIETVNELHGETLKKLDDDALIDAMAQASAECSPKDWLYADDWFKNKYIEQSIAALSVCRPIIERETRERCVSVSNGLIAELRAENEKLRDKLADEEYVSKDLEEMFQTVRAENEKLRAALKPFADAAADYIDEKSDTHRVVVMLGEIRAAATALKETE